MGLALAVPLLARQEELWFRSGTETSSLVETLARSLLFGLVHVLAGVPVAAALALSVPGLVFATVYRLAFDSSRIPALVAAPTINWSDYETIPDTRGRLAWLEAQLGAEERSSRNRGDWQASQRQARELATDVAAAAHTVSNWCAIGLLLVVLALG